MAARDEILRALREAAPEEQPRPAVRVNALRYDDLEDRFAKAVIENGGRFVRVQNGVQGALDQIPEYAAAKRIASLVPEARGNTDVASAPDPHALADVDFCVLQAELGVAESAAMWITQHGGRNRSVCYLTQHLAVVVRRDTLVHTLHEALQRISLPKSGFAMFLSGPSKTADIEQALVIGAHGARSCTVLLTG